MPDSIQRPPCPPLILEGELDTTAGIDDRSDTCGCERHARYLTPPLRLEGGRGALNAVGNLSPHWIYFSQNTNVVNDGKSMFLHFLIFFFFWKRNSKFICNFAAKYCQSS